MDGCGDDFRGVVRVMLFDSLSQCFETHGGRFDEKQKFMVKFDFIFPDIMGFESGDDIDTGSQLLCEQFMRNAPTRFQVGNSDKDDFECLVFVQLSSV